MAVNLRLQDFLKNLLAHFRALDILWVAILDAYQKEPAMTDTEIAALLAAIAAENPGTMFGY